MSIAPLPTPLQHLGGRRFSFYPPIRNLANNEWLYRRATWSECVVANAKSGEEFWIPRRFLAEVARVDDAVMVVGLNRELEWRRGSIMPRERRVIEMPARLPVATTARDSPAQVINIRLEARQETRAWKWLGVAVVLGAVAFKIISGYIGAIDPGEIPKHGRMLDAARHPTHKTPPLRSVPAF